MRLELDIRSEVVLHVLVVLTGIMAVWLFWPPTNTSENADQRPPWESIDIPERALGVKGADSFVYILTSLNCPYTAKSLDFYADLRHEIDSVRHAVVDVAFLLVLNSESTMSHREKRLQLDIFRSSGIGVDSLVTLPFSSLDIPGTPAIVVSQRNDDVAAAWVGYQRERGQEAIREALQSL